MIGSAHDRDESGALFRNCKKVGYARDVDIQCRILNLATLVNTAMLSQFESVPALAVNLTPEVTPHVCGYSPRFKRCVKCSLDLL
jgi:hypothetical protein